MTDDDLREQLRRADPAASLKPIAPTAVSRLLEDAMTTTDDSPRTTHPAARRRLPLLAAAAAALVLLAVGSAALIIGTGSGGTARPSAVPTAAIGQTVTRLSLGDGGAAVKCAAPEAGQLAATAQLAFEGTVLRIKGGVVTLQVKHLWTGAKSELVEIAQPDETEAALLAGVVFKPGDTYLIAAADGQVMSCAYSGLSNPELRALYDAAF